MARTASTRRGARRGMAGGSRYRAPALDKGLDILELQALEERGYLARENDAGYVLTNRLFMLGMERPPIKSLVEAALPVMHRLAREIQQPCHLVVPSEDQIVVIARVDAPGDVGFVVRVGHRLPIVHSTSGAVLFAFQDEPERARWLELTDKAGIRYRRRQFIGQADAIRAQGHAALPSTAVDGVTDLSAPILRQGRPAGALTIPFVERHPQQVSLKRAIERLHAAVRDISRELTA